jgi:hypothetical protein
MSSKQNTKWTENENKNLARAWIGESESSSVGADQTSDTFMSKVHNKFIEFEKEDNPLIEKYR